MKKIALFMLLPVFGITACSQNGNKSSTGNSTGLVLGSSASTITKTPNNQKKPIGPLGYGLEVPKAIDKDTIDVKFDVTHQEFKVKNGVSFIAWEFGGSVPGPTLKVRVGQTVRFSMTNRSDENMSNVSMNMQGQNMHTDSHQMDMSNPGAPMPHSIDFHAAMVNPEDKYRTVSPGETIHFTWTANYPGVFMYHCGTPMVLRHMIYGMIGMAIVEPKEGFPEKVDKEFAIVQNEFYLIKQGAHYIPDTAAAMRKQPTYVAFNGKPGQYVVKPIKVKAGEKIRIYLLNAGPNNASAFHIIGTILDKVWLDGNPKNEMYGLQSLYLGPANGAIIDFVLPEKGNYPFVDHSFADAEMGAMGVFKAE